MVVYIAVFGVLSVQKAWSVVGKVISCWNFPRRLAPSFVPSCSILSSCRSAEVCIAVLHLVKSCVCGVHQRPSSRSQRIVLISLHFCPLFVPCWRFVLLV